MIDVTPVLYDCEPIGVDGAYEAVAVRFFCSEKCRSEASKELHSVHGTDDSWVDGTQCETCGVTLTYGTR